MKFESHGTFWNYACWGIISGLGDCLNTILYFFLGLDCIFVFDKLSDFIYGLLLDLLKLKNVSDINHTDLVDHGLTFLFIIYLLYIFGKFLFLNLIFKIFTNAIWLNILNHRYRLVIHYFLNSFLFLIFLNFIISRRAIKCLFQQCIYFFVLRIVLCFRLVFQLVEFCDFLKYQLLQVTDNLSIFFTFLILYILLIKFLIVELNDLQNFWTKLCLDVIRIVLLYDWLSNMLLDLCF